MRQSTSEAREPRPGWWKLAVLVVFVAGASVLVRWSGVLDRVTVADIYRVRDSAGVLAPIAFVFVYIAGTLVAFPGFLLTFTGGLLFGTAYGGALVVVGATIGAIGAFLISRYAGRASVERFIAGGAVERFDKTVAGSGFSAVVFTRLLPVFPFNVVNFAWGLSGVSLRDYALGTAIGIIPAAVIYANIAAAVGRTLGDVNTPISAINVRSLANRDVGLALALLGVLAIVPPVVKLLQRWRATRANLDDAE